MPVVHSDNQNESPEEVEAIADIVAIFQHFTIPAALRHAVELLAERYRRSGVHLVAAAEALDRTDEESVDVVGYSAGGLIARVWVAGSGADVD